MKQKQCHLLLDIKTTIFVEKSYNFTRNSTYINSRVLSVYDLAVCVSWVHLDLHLLTKNDDSLQSCGGVGTTTLGAFKATFPISTLHTKRPFIFFNHSPPFIIVPLAKFDYR